MNVNLTLQQIGAWILRAAAAAGLVISSTNSLTSVNSKNVVGMLVSAVYLMVDRYLTDPGTGTTTPTTVIHKSEPPA